MTAATASDRGRAVELTWFGQSAFRLAADGEVVLVDPFLSRRPDRRYEPPAVAAQLLDTTTVLCTHEHDDHLDLAFLRDLLAAGGRPRIVVPAPILPLAAAGGLDGELLVGAVPGSELTLGRLAVHPVPAVHGIGGDLPVEYGFWPAGQEAAGYRFLGYVFELGGIRFFHSGDALLYADLAPRLRELAPDVLLLPINGRDHMREAFGCVGNMNEDEAAWLCREVAPPYVVPMHYEGFANNLGDVGRFAAALGDAGPTALLVPPRGRQIRLALR